MFMLKKKHKTYLKLNIISILFTVISFISATLAWFAYSGLVDVKTEIGVKAWYIEFDKDNEKVSNDIVIALSDIYPGMDTVTELITIKNLGDTDDKLKYKINSARILNDEKDYYEVGNKVTSTYIEDALSHNYPFHINISLSKEYLNSKDEDATFEVSISWPLDSGDDILDSTWGSNAFMFEESEKSKKENDSNYQIEPSIKVVINVVAEQSIDELSDTDPDYQLGSLVLYDVVNNQICDEISDSCIETHVLDTNNLISDRTVRLLPSFNDYTSVVNSEYSNKFNEIISSWNVNTENLKATDIIKVVSTDINNSYIKNSDISDQIIGSTNYGTRANDILNKVITSNSYITYNKVMFPYLTSFDCIWTSDSYNDKVFTLIDNDSTSMKLDGSSKDISCKVIPVIVANKKEF